MRKIFSQSGFTLIEVLLTVALLAVIVAFGAPNMAEFLEKRQNQLIASNINDAFVLARSVALNSRSPVSVCWNTGGAINNSARLNTIVVTVDNVDGVEETVKSVDIGREGYRVIDTDVPDQCISFNELGRSTVGVLFGVCRIDGKIENLMTVRLSNTGRPAILRADKSDPNPNNFDCS